MSTVTGAFYKMYYNTPLNPKKSKTWRSTSKNLEIYQQRQKELNQVQGTLKNENGSLRIHLTGYEPSYSVLNVVFAQ